MSALEGLRVLDISAYAPGRFATMLLADLGAEVIGIEMVSGGRKGGFKMLEDDTHPRWLWHQRNKRSMTLNLKSEAGLALFKKMAADADVVVEAFKPGTAQRLGVDYDAIRAANPKIIYCSISGFGQDGPYAQLTNHEANHQALSGVMERNRLRDGEPHMSSAFVGDLAGGSMNAVIAILAAVIHRARSGEGQYIDVAMTAGLLPLLGYHAYSNQRPPSPRFFSTVSPAHNIVPEQAVYRTKDGRHVAISIPEPWLYQRACNEFGCPEIIPNQFSDDEDIRRQSFERLQQVFLTKTRDEWEAFNHEKDLGISPVKDLSETFTDPQMLHRGMIIDYDYAPVGPTKHVGVPFILSKTPAMGVRNIPRYGEDTDTILREFGLSEAEIEGLKEQGAC
jgi:crotonobetainyl-CoA:carnitine CoA-transferase CaiB-like acyl-CoA transferase